MFTRRRLRIIYYLLANGASNALVMFELVPARVLLSQRAQKANRFDSPAIRNSYGRKMRIERSRTHKNAQKFKNHIPSNN